MDRADKELQEEYQQLHSWRRYLCCYNINVRQFFPVME